MSENIKAYNSEIQKKARELRGAFKNRVISLQETSGGDSEKLKNNIRVKFKRNFGEIDHIRFAYPRHGYFFMKGVGKGYKSTGNSVIRIAKTDSGKRRQSQDWMTPLDEYEKQFADIAQEHFANRAIDIKHLKTRRHGH